MDYRQLMRMAAASRAAIGATLTILPGFAGGLWIGPAAKDPTVKVMIRAMGVRDMALGVGMLKALSSGEPTRTWALLGGLSDAVDAAATVRGAGSIGVAKALPTILVATTSAIGHFSAANQLD